MALRLASGILASSSCDFQNESAVQLKDCTMRNDGRSYSKFPHRGAVEMRWLNSEISEGDFQFVNFCNGLDEPKAAMIYSGTSLGESTLRLRPRRPHCYAYAGFGVITGWRISGQLPAEVTRFVRNKDPCFPAITECRADCYLNQPESSYLAVRCNANSSDEGKEEFLWTNESVTTASGALAEWRSSRSRSGQNIVDWGRYHLQVMFVDRSHRARSRLAEGLFERIAAWNGFGLILYGHSCGINAIEGELPNTNYQSEAHRLGVARHVFRAPATTLDRSDLDSYDLIVAMDSYDHQVRLISEFVSYGTTSLLEDTLLDIVQPDLPQARSALEVQATFISQYSKWRMMVATITICCASLIQFLMEAYPDDLPDYDPVD